MPESDGRFFVSLRTLTAATVLRPSGRANGLSVSTSDLALTLGETGLQLRSSIASRQTRMSPI